MTDTDSHAPGFRSAITVPATTSVAARFPSPQPEYGLILWWGRDGPMSEEVVVRDLDEIRERGVCCVMIKAGYGMNEAEYVHRASYLLSTGRPAAQIALYYPTSSLWLGDEHADERT